jgi:hypothetical protein
MSESRYSYSFKGHVRETKQDELTGASMQTLLAIRDTLKVITGACEVCQFNEASVCQKHWHVIKEGDPRCDDFARRLSWKPGEEPDRKYVQEYVYDVLGIRESTLERLTRRVK